MFEAREDAQQRRLPHTVGPDDADAAARPDVDVDPVEHGVAAEAPGDVARDEGEGTCGRHAPRLSEPTGAGGVVSGSRLEADRLGERRAPARVPELVGMEVVGGELALPRRAGVRTDRCNP